MKRLISLILCVMLLISVAACGTSNSTEASGSKSNGAPAASSGSEELVNQDVVTILTHVSSTDHTSFMGTFLAYAEYMYSDIEVEVINLNVGDQAEYYAKLSQLRVDIMAGKGPDIFLLPTDTFLNTDTTDGFTYSEDAFFSDIAEAIDSRFFLPLDDYIADSEHIRMENYPEAVIEAGKGDEGQAVMPLAYNYHLLLLDKEKMADPDMTYTSFEDLISCGDVNLVKTVGMKYTLWYRSLFSDIADYGSGTLTITEEDLYSAVEATQFDYTGADNDYDLRIGNYDIPGKYGFLDFFMSDAVLGTWELNREIVYPVHIPNTDDGITAYIPAFAAINANSTHPDDAFRIFELLFSDVVMQGKPYDNYNSTIKGSIVNTFVPGENAVSIDTNAVASAAQKELLTEMNLKITTARFENGLEDLLYEAGASYLNTERQILEEPERREELLRAAIEDVYTKMKMEMAE